MGPVGPICLIDGVRLLCSPGSTGVAEATTAAAFLCSNHGDAVGRKGALIGAVGDAAAAVVVDDDGDSVAQGVALNKVVGGDCRHLARP